VRNCDRDECRKREREIVRKGEKEREDEMKRGVSNNERERS
jgi:hypothetical protein